MNTNYKMTARTVSQTPIATFQLKAGEDLDVRVQAEIDKAIVDGKLDTLATRVGLPALAVSIVAEGENMAGDDNVVGHHLYAPDGAPLAERSYRTEAIGDGVALVAVMDEHDETPVGVFASLEVADQVGTLWRNGHISLATS